MTPTLSRRKLLTCACMGAGAFVAAPAFDLLAGRLAFAQGHDAPSGDAPSLTPDEALQRLKDGNREFLDGTPYHGALSSERRLEIAQAQHPFAVLVSCSDSRVPPELLFGRGLGELFIVRNAGNTVDTVALGSIQYAVEHLGTPLIVVMGHQRCGAVSAAVSMYRDHQDFDGAIGSMLEPILPAVIEAAREDDDDDDLIDNAVRENVRRVVRHLREAPEDIMAGPLKAGRLKVVGAEYYLDDGSVDFFDEA
jgi:carbonic anhydrase